MIGHVYVFGIECDRLYICVLGVEYERSCIRLLGVEYERSCRVLGYLLSGHVGC